MEHPFFEKVKYNSEVVDRYASSLVESSDIKFSQMFSILFPGQRQHSANVSSYLAVVSSWFWFPERAVGERVIREVEKMFLELDIPNPRDRKNIGAFQFCSWLVWALQKHGSVGYRLNDNIFHFMEGFPITDTKVVIIGNNPAKYIPSSGYAFHKSVCPSTKQILEFVSREMNLVFEHQRNPLFHISDHDLSNLKNGCSLQGWINQGVLLLNANLTRVGNNSARHSVWTQFATFLLKYLNGKKKNLVFIFLGRDASRLQRWICKRNHCVLMLHHPSYYAYVPGPVAGNKDWINMLPFLNANFYLYQKMQGIEMMIDWNNISGTDDSNREERMTQLRRLFTEIIQAAHHTPSQRFGRFSIVRRNDSEILSLELAEIH